MITGGHHDGTSNLFYHPPALLRLCRRIHKRMVVSRTQEVGTYFYAAQLHSGGESTARGQCKTRWKKVSLLFVSLFACCDTYNHSDLVA